ncbi:14111_t:CDS:2, partial [Funneliformis mosseae]
ILVERNVKSIIDAFELNKDHSNDDNVSTEGIMDLTPKSHFVQQLPFLESLNQYDKLILDETTQYRYRAKKNKIPDLQAPIRIVTSASIRKMSGCLSSNINNRIKPISKPLSRYDIAREKLRLESFLMKKNMVKLMIKLKNQLMNLKDVVFLYIVNLVLKKNLTEKWKIGNRVQDIRRFVNLKLILMKSKSDVSSVLTNDLFLKTWLD